VDLKKGKYQSLIELMAGRVRGRKHREDMTYFINSGTQGLQFAVERGRVYQLAKEKGVGREIPTEWFLQDIRG